MRILTLLRPPATRLLQMMLAKRGATRWRWRSGTAWTTTGSRWRWEDEDADDSITVKISVRDRDEPPAVPTVTVTSPVRDTTNNITTLEVFWHARNTGPDIASYDVQYRKGGASSFLDDNCRGVTGDGNCLGIIGTNTTIITRLDADISYSVQVRARNEEGTSNWSRLLTVKTNKGENNPPTFQESDPVTLNVLENTPDGRDVGNAVGGEDDASTSLTYSLGGRDAALFTIVPSSRPGPDTDEG